MAIGTSRSTNRQRVLGLERNDDLVRVGEQVDRKLQTDKTSQSGTIRFGRNQTNLGGRSVLEDTGRDVSPESSRKFRESPEFFQKEEVELSTPELLAKRTAEPVKADVGVKPVTGAVRVKEAKAVPKFGDVTKLKRGESIGNVSIGRETASEEAQRKFGVKPKGKASVFSAEGIRSLFGSAADLAKVFASTEFQERKAKGLQAGAGAKGLRADAKAKTEKIKALGSVRSQIAESDLESPLLQKIDAQIQSLITGADASDTSQKIGVLGNLLKLGPLTKEQEQLFTGA